ncbi:ABC transporter permease [Herbiconiux sp. A18JL235]|uniref:ABC transporter permease n=1 Tax=Herbiconiux sp. A18JL235 TaxID=3152363 RepID=A0AB39BDZ7_9MICO
MITLLALRLRRDAVQLALWIVGAAGLALLSVGGIASSYGTEQNRADLLATAIANPVVLLFRGLPSGAGEGAFAAFLILPFIALLAAFMSVFLAVRHTRADEEAGRAELLGVTRAGRLLPLAATAVHGLLANVVLAALVAVSLVATGLPVGGSLMTGAASGAVGLVFLGVGLVAAQVLPTPRAANAAAVWVLMTTFVLAGLGNALGAPSADLQSVESSGLTWVSPFGWAENTRPFADDSGLPVLLCLAVGVALGAIAAALQARRDVGASLVPERRGSSDAGTLLATPTALVWRLTWPAVVGWAVGGLLTGLLATTLSGVLQQAASQLPSVQAVIDALSAGGSLAQGAVVIFFTMLGILAACCAVQVVSRARHEEAHGTAEPVLAAAVTRMQWLAGYVVVAMVGILAVITAAVAGAALGLAGQSDPDWSLMGDVLVTAGGQMAAASVFLVLTALLLVLAPRLTVPVGWALVLVGAVLGLFGGLFGFPEWLVDLSPVAVSPTVGADGVELRGLGWLVVAALAGGAASFALMRRRESAPGE